MSPTPLPPSPRRVRPWLAAALLMTVWLSSTPARCDSGPGIARLAASTLAGPAWHWLQLAWAGFQSWGPGGARDGQAYRPAIRATAGGWQGAGGADSAAPEDTSTGGGSAVGGSGSGSGNTGGSDPNG
jgi:hypothetical protein